MGKKLGRIFSVLLSVVIVLSNLGVVGATEGAAPLIEKSDLAIASGTVYDLSAEPGAGDLYSLRDATIYVEYQSTSSEQYQSLFSVSNPGTAKDDMYRHFHLYVTPTGTLGMELRNTDSDFKYTMSAAGAVTHGAQNRIAFKADSQSKTYKLFANGQMVGELTKDDYRFFADILGLSNASIGGTIRNGEVDYPFAGTVSNVQVYSSALSDAELIEKTYVDTSLPVMEQSDVEITPGSYVDLSNEANAEVVKHLREGTIVISFTTTSTAGVQSLFSVGNSTSGNKDRHFHLYLTDTGALGMELRNTDLSFKYTMSRPAVLDGLDHGAPAVNTVAFKADADTHTYKLFANGDLITTLEEDDWKFISDIAGVDNIALGATIRNGAAAYPYGGTIQDFAVYTEPLSDEALLEMTGATAHGTKIFYAGDGTGSNYYRIPTLLTLESGVVVSSIDTRYGGTHDARSNIDIGFSRSTDGGKTWSAPTLPLVFDDYAPQAVEWPRDLIGKNIQISGSASFIDTVLLEDRETGRLFLFSDAFTSGKGFNNVVGRHRF